jgi:hypothetical protein
MASNDGEAEVGELGAELGCRHAKANPWIGARMVVGGFQVGEAGLGQPGKRSPGVAGKRIADGVELESNAYGHRGSFASCSVGGIWPAVDG